MSKAQESGSRTTEVNVLSTARWELLWTSVGLKAVMAVSGAILSGWVLAHMAGNLLVFGGPELINAYANALQSGPILWLQRAVVIAALAAHASAALVLTKRSHEARTDRYRRRLSTRKTTFSARTMRWGGLFVLLFIAYHIVHIYGPLHASYVPGDVYHNVVVGMRDPVAAVLYIAATLVFGLHLHHGTASLFRSLGHARLFETSIRRASRSFTVLVTLGFLAPCVAALAGWL
jgi:succinate dehydrogenase / fumarate reductase cytochrome b subunit